MTSDFAALKAFLLMNVNHKHNLLHLHQIYKPAGKRQGVKYIKHATICLIPVGLMKPGVRRKKFWYYGLNLCYFNWYWFNHSITDWLELGHRFANQHILQTPRNPVAILEMAL